MYFLSSLKKQINAVVAWISNMWSSGIFNKEFSFRESHVTNNGRWLSFQNYVDVTYGLTNAQNQRQI